MSGADRVVVVIDTNTVYRGRRWNPLGLYKHPLAHTSTLQTLVGWHQNNVFFSGLFTHRKLIPFNVSASINNPMRSSLKKPKNKETASVASAASKKSVRIALGEEQTAV